MGDILAFCGCISCCSVGARCEPQADRTPVPLGGSSLALASHEEVSLCPAVAQPTPSILASNEEWILSGTALSQVSVSISWPSLLFGIGQGSSGSGCITFVPTGSAGVGAPPPAKTPLTRTSYRQWLGVHRQRLECIGAKIQDLGHSPPGKPTDNGFVESFKGKPRDE